MTAWRPRHRASGALAAAVAIAMASASCSDAAAPDPVASVRISPAELTLVVGQTVRLSATPLGPNGPLNDREAVVWSSTNPQVATVDSQGVVTTLAPGMTLITAACEGQLGTATISVIPIPVSTVTVNPSTATLGLRETLRLVATTLDSTGAALAGRAMAWSSSDSRVAAVDPTGMVTALSPGAASIMAVSEGRSGTASIAVSASIPCGFGSPPPIEVGQTGTGSLTVSDCPLGDGTVYDVYRLTLAAPSSLAFELRSPAFESFLLLVDARYYVLDLSGLPGGSVARIRRTLPAGTYYVIANSWSPGFGDYQLSVMPATTEPGDPASADGRFAPFGATLKRVAGRPRT